ncbi:MAG: zinc-binding dehydrogenase [Myxococcota bacterium]
MRAWRTHSWGQPEAVLQCDDIPVPDPGPGELLVRTQALPLNLNDMERITGGNMMVTPELPLVPGMEVQGIVERGGEGVEDWAGRRVVAMTKQATGGWAEFAICPAVSAFDVPDAIEGPEAGAFFFPFHLAGLGLWDRAELQAGETVLIHAAAGGTGAAAVQIARQAGARVIATVGSEAKAAFAKRLGADVTVRYREEDFTEVVLAETAGRGVDVVFDGVGEAVLDGSMKSLAYHGRYVMIGFASDKSVADAPSLVPRRIATGNFRLCGVLLAYAPEPLIPVMKKGMGWNFCPRSVGDGIHARILEGFAAGQLNPVLGRTADFDAIPREIQALFDRETMGRTVACWT